jgi:hypothetical protein
MAGFRGVRRRADQARGAANEAGVQRLLDSPGATAVPGGIAIGGAPGSVGETSSSFYEDPTVNALVKLPSLEQAKAYKGTDPSFHGVQRPGDYQRVVQREMADAVAGGKLAQLIENRVEGAKFQAGDYAPSAAVTARAMGGGFRGVSPDFTVDEAAPRRRPGRFA